jgi:hypothetical protein
MYETEHLRANDPNFVDTKDRKLMRASSIMIVGASVTTLMLAWATLGL